MKLINNADIASNSEVFTDQWYLETSENPGVKHLAYIENNGNITGKGTNFSTEHGIYLHSAEDFYFKNSGKITSMAARNEIGALNNLIIENKGSENEDSACCRPRILRNITVKSEKSEILAVSHFKRLKIAKFEK